MSTTPARAPCSRGAPRRELSHLFLEDRFLASANRRLALGEDVQLRHLLQLCSGLYSIDAFSLSACHLTGCQRPPKTMTGVSHRPGDAGGTHSTPPACWATRLAAICSIALPSNGTRIGRRTSVCVWSVLMMSITTREVPLVSCGMLSTPLHMVVRTASPCDRSHPSSRHCNERANGRSCTRREMIALTAPCCAQSQIHRGCAWSSR